MNILNLIIKPIHAISAVDVVGTLQLPAGIPSDISKTNLFFSAIVRMLMVVGGIFSLWQFLSGGFQFISSGGEKGKIAEAQQKIQMSIIGLVAMTASFIVISIISKILFGSFTFILNPVLETVN